VSGALQLADLVDLLAPHLPVLGVGLLLLLAPAILWVSHVSHQALVATLRGLAGRLAAGQVTVSGFWATTPVLELRGALRGHAVRVHFALRGRGRSTYRVTALEVQVHHPAGSFEVTEDSAVDRLERWLGVAAGEPLEPGIVARRRAGGAGALLQAREVQAALRRVLALPGVDGVVLRAGTLYVDQRAAPSVDGLAAALEAIVGLAQVVGREPLPAVALRPRAPARFAWTGGEAEPRCPYCRSAIAGTETAACDRCGTSHHADCLAEAGGCTIFGCGERGAPGRIRT
jgi:hypothetical protein